MTNTQSSKEKNLRRALRRFLIPQKEPIRIKPYYQKGEAFPTDPDDPLRVYQSRVNILVDIIYTPQDKTISMYLERHVERDFNMGTGYFIDLTPEQIRLALSDIRNLESRSERDGRIDLSLLYQMFREGERVRTRETEQPIPIHRRNCDNYYTSR